MVSHPELSSDPPIGSDWESGRDMVSASVKDLLTKNTGFNFASPHSLNKAALIAILEAAR